MPPARREIAPVFLRLGADGLRREAQRVAVESEQRRTTKKPSWLDPQHNSAMELRLRTTTAARVGAMDEAAARDAAARAARDSESRNAAAQLAAAMAAAGLGGGGGGGGGGGSVSGSCLAHRGDSNSRMNSRANSRANTPRRDAGASSSTTINDAPPGHASRKGSFDELGYHIDKVLLSEVESGLQFTKVAGGAYVCSHTQERMQQEADDAEAERKRLVRAKLDADTAKAEADRKRNQQKAEEAQRAMVAAHHREG